MIYTALPPLHSAAHMLWAGPGKARCCCFSGDTSSKLLLGPSLCAGSKCPSDLCQAQHALWLLGCPAGCELSLRNSVSWLGCSCRAWPLRQPSNVCALECRSGLSCVQQAHRAHAVKDFGSFCSNLHVRSCAKLAGWGSAAAS